MDRFPRGTLPPSAFQAIARSVSTTRTDLAYDLGSPSNGVPEPEPQTDDGAPDEGKHFSRPVVDAARTCDLSTTCPNCNTLMQPEHAHYKCGKCGYRDSCCF